MNPNIKFNKKELIEEIKRKWADGKAARGTREAEMLINYLSYKKSDKVFYLSENNDVKEISITQLRKLEEMKTNRIFPVVRRMDNQIEARRPLFRANVRDYTVKDFDARIQQAIAVNKYEEWEDNGILDELRIWYITTGNWCLKQYFNNKKGKTVQLHSLGEEIKEGTIEEDVVPIFEIVFDKSVTNSLRSNWAIQRIIIPKKRSKEIFKKDIQTIRIEGDYSIDYNTGNYFIKGEEYCIVYELYMTPNEQYKKGLFVQTDLKEILDIDDNPAPKHRLPFIHSKALELTEVVGDTPVSYARPSMKELNLRHVQHGRHIKAFGKPILAIDRRSKFDEAKFGTDKVTVVKQNLKEGRIPQYIMPAEFSRGFYEHMAMLRGQIDDITGTQGLGEVGKRTSAMSLAIQKEFYDSDNAQIVKRFYRGIAHALNMHLDYVKERHTEEREIEYFDDEDYLYTKYIGSRLKKGIKVKLVTLFGLSDNPIIRQQQVEKMMALGLVGKSKALDLMQFGDVNRGYNPEMEDKIRACMENDAMTHDDMECIVDMYENHLTHIKKHRQRLRKGDMFIHPKYTKPNDRNKIVARRIRLYGHIEKHWIAIGELINQNLMQAAMILSFETMGEMEWAVFQQALSQLNQKAIDEENANAKVEGRQPRDLSKTNVSKMAQGLGGISPSTAALKNLQAMTNSNIVNDMAGQNTGENIVAQ